MRSGSRLAVFLVLLLPALAGCLSDSPTEKQAVQTTDSTGAVEGRVVNDEWLPIKDADVTLLEVPLSVRTDAGGAFVFENVEPGEYTLVTVRLGYFQKAAKIDVLADMVTDVDVVLEQVPVADPPFDDVTVYNGSMIVGLAASDPEPVAGDDIDSKDFTLVIPTKKEDGTRLAAMNAHIELVVEDAPNAVDLDLYLLAPNGDELASSTSGGPNEIINHPEYMPAGDYTIRVIFWAGAAADFTVTATVTYEQGEAADYAIRKATG